MKFTIEEFRNYLEKQNSRGDIMYNLSEENIQKAQIKEDVEEYERNLYSSDEIRAAFPKQGRSWNYRDLNLHKFKSTSLPVSCAGGTAMEPGDEILGTYCGYEFESEDGEIHAKFEEGIRGMVVAMIYRTTDGKCIMFH